MAIDYNNEILLAAMAEMGISSDVDEDDEFGEFDGDALDVESMQKREIERLDHYIKDMELGMSKPRPGRGAEVTIGFDTEYLTDEEAQEHLVLSYQFHLIGPHGEYQRIFYPKAGDRVHRLALDDMLSKTIQEATDSGAIEVFPQRINLCGFFLRLDLGTLGDFNTFKRSLSNIGGKLGTLGRNVLFGKQLEHIGYLQRSASYVTQDDDAFPRIMSVRFLDVGSHAPEGSNLASIGEALGLPKLKLPNGYKIERMDELLVGDRNSFEAYALRDAEIAAKYFVKLQALAKKVAKAKELPATASGHGVALFRQTLKDSNVDFNRAFGVRDHTPIVFDEATGRPRKGKTEQVRINRRDMYEHFIKKCYHGGHNECFMAGPTSLGLFNDFDLAGAYTTGMVDFPVLDFDKPARISRSPDDYRGHVVGFAHIQFTYPASTRFPALPVESHAHGLIYPLSGESYCTAPEIEVALNQGCEITILDGVIYEQVEDLPRMFEPFVTKIRELRSDYRQQYDRSVVQGRPKSGLLLWEKYIKLVGNGLYGKTAQGLKEKRAFDAGELKSVELPPSAITFAACAAHVTGFVRAVMVEIMHSIPAHRTVVSVTTDGFLTDAVDGELCISGPLAGRFDALHRRVAPVEQIKLPDGAIISKQKPMLELKHQGAQIIAMKTRGQLTASALKDKPLILAKGSVSPPLKRTDDQSADDFKALQNQYMLDLYLNRIPGQKTEIRPFVSLRDQMVHDKDVVRLSRAVRLNLEFDFKRKPINPTVRAVGEREHLAFDTVAWNSADEVDVVRQIFDKGWRKSHCLKTMQDWHGWEDYRASKMALNKSKKHAKTGINLTAKGAKGVVVTTFLRAYTRSLWGIEKSLSYADLADWLTQTLEALSHSFPGGNEHTVKKYDVTYAARLKNVPDEACCARLPETEALVGCLKAKFTGLEEHRFFAVTRA